MNCLVKLLLLAITTTYAQGDDKVDASKKSPPITVTQRSVEDILDSNDTVFEAFEIHPKTGNIKFLLEIANVKKNQIRPPILIIKTDSKVVASTPISFEVLNEGKKPLFGEFSIAPEYIEESQLFLLFELYPDKTETFSIDLNETLVNVKTGKQSWKKVKISNYIKSLKIDEKPANDR